MKNDLDEDVFIGMCSLVSNKFSDTEKPDIELLSINHFIKRGCK